MGFMGGKGVVVDGRKLAIVVALVSLLGSISAAPATAAPMWMPAADLSKPGRDAFNPSVAVDPAGNTVAIWERQIPTGPSHNVQVSIRPFGGAFGEPLDLSTRATEPRIAMSPAGEAAAAWKHFDINSGKNVIQVATRPPGGSFTPPASVYAAPVGVIPQQLQVAIGNSGAVAVAWSNLDPGSELNTVTCPDSDPMKPDPPCPNPFFVEASSRPAGGSFSPPGRISPPRGNPSEGETKEQKEERFREESQLTAGEPRIAVDGAGVATAVWTYFDGTDVVVQTAKTAAGGAFSAPVTVSPAGEDSAFAEVGADNAGNAIAVWTQIEGLDGRIHAAVAPPGGPFAPGAPISAAGQDAEAPDLAVSGGGTAVASWRLSGISESVIQTATRPPGGVFSGPTAVSSGKDNPLFADTAVNDSAGAAVVWSGDSGANEVVRGTVRPTGSGFVSPVNISAASPELFHPSIGIDAGGNATTVWSRSNGTHDIIQVAGYDGRPPELRDVSIPATGTVGVPVQFSATPFDAWPIGPAGFSFGDGGSATGNSVSHAYGAAGTYAVVVSATDGTGSTTTSTGAIRILPKCGLKLGKLKRNKKRGTAVLPVTVESAGAVTAVGKGAKRAKARAPKPGTVKLPIRASGRRLKTLNKAGKLKLRLTVTLTPDGGSACRLRPRVRLLKTLD